MTIEEILKCSADELEKMTSEDLSKHFEQYYPITRPERVAKLPAAKTPTVINPKLAQANELFKQLGMDIDVNSVLSPVKKKK